MCRLRFSLYVPAVVWCCLLLLLPACQVLPPPAVVGQTSLPTEVATQTAVMRPSIIPPAGTALASLPTATHAARVPTASLPAELAICSPLEGIPIEELSSPDLLKTQFQLPRPGRDDGHHGVDFAYWSRGERTTMRGHPVQAVLAGRVAGVVPNRSPYGYAVIIETPLEAFPAHLLQALPLPDPLPTVQPDSSLSCPAGPVEWLPTSTARSLYLLYAHMNEPPLVQVDQVVDCGETIGAVGTTGKSVNDHLHLETRLGLSGAEIPVMAHYDNAATDAEMRAYCTWRVSGSFMMIDPLTLFTLQP